MRIKRNEKYASISFYAIITVLISALIALVLFKFSAVRRIIGTVFGILSPITYGFVLAYICNPMVRFFENRVFRFPNAKVNRKKLKRILSILVSYVILIALVAAFFLLLIPQISTSYTTLSSKMGDYIVSAQNLANNVIRSAQRFLDDHGSLKEIINIDKISGEFNSFLSNVPDYVKTGAGYLIGFLTDLISEIKNLLIGFFLSIYMLYSKEKVCAQFKMFLASFTKRKTYLNVISLARFTDRAFGGFLTGKILDSLIIGLISFIVFGLLGFSYYPLIAVIMAVTNIIPIFGPFIGGGIIGIILLITEPSKLLLFVIVTVIIQQFDGNILGPKILGDSTGLSGMWVMISIIIGGGLFGFAGMIFGVPLFAVIYSLVREFSESRLRKKGVPANVESYFDDPPKKNYLNSDIFIGKDEEIPENMLTPVKVEKTSSAQKKKMWKKVEEKAIEKAKKKIKKK